MCLTSKAHKVICSLACAMQSTYFLASEAIVCKEPPIPGYPVLQLVFMASFPGYKAMVLSSEPGRYTLQSFSTL